jgi:hypothetical protein
MTHKQRILAACRGEVPDRVPWVPRLDLWYNAHSRAGTLPAPFQKASLRQITNALGVGHHAVVPNFLDIRSPDDTIDRTLGIYRLGTMPFETRLHNVRREVQIDGDKTRVIYHTPAGRVSGTFLYTPEMKEAGASISWIGEHLLKGPADYPVLEYIFANLEVVRTYDSYRAWQEWVGEDGVAVAFASLSASPVHHIMRELMPMTDFFLEMHDRPNEIASLARSMERWFRDMFATLVESPAEVIFLGANYDETITYPPFFAEHILPWLAELADLAHRHGKLLLTHTDGENERLLNLYRRSRFDIADSVCPCPMTKLTLRQTMEQLPGVTVWGGIPSVALCKASMNDADFERLVDETLAFARGQSHLILGIADTTPPGAEWDRLLQITRQVNN